MGVSELVRQATTVTTQGVETHVMTVSPICNKKIVSERAKRGIKNTNVLLKNGSRELEKYMKGFSIPLFF
jgi:hypothetical protein